MRVAEVTGRTGTVVAGGPLTADAALVANRDRKRLFIQNQDSAKLFVKLGDGCDTNDYHFILRASTVAADGTGGTLSVSYYTGAVSVKDGGGGANAGSYSLAELV